MKKRCKKIDVGIDEVEILKNEKHHAGGDNADDKKSLSSYARTAFNIDGSRVIDGNGSEQNKDVGRYKCHIENAACTEEMHPAELVWQ